ncbi:MAG: FecR domain-containing protein [Pseudoxanthomonas sp.]
MNEEDKPIHRRPSAAVARQAERWLARLHSPACGSQERRRFQDWLAEHPTHWQAYNQAEQLWAAASQVRDPQLDALAEQVLRRAQRQRQAPRPRWRLLGWTAAAAVLVLAVGIAGKTWLAREPAAITYATAIGEIRSFTLADDSVVTLDTDTVLQVRMGRQARSVALQRGQAQFKVAHDPRRPFTVATPQAAVTAIGTLFQVRNGGQATEIDLLEGRVRVTPGPAAQAAAPQPQELRPGERLLARADAPWVRTRADLAAANGWLSGRLVFDALPLRQAVEEFNRYSPRKLRIADPGIAAIPIAGVFDAGDTDSIVLALQYAYPLRAEEQAGEVVLRHK